MMSMNFENPPSIFCHPSSSGMWSCICMVARAYFKPRGRVSRANRATPLKAGPSPASPEQNLPQELCSSPPGNGRREQDPRCPAVEDTASSGNAQQRLASSPRAPSAFLRTLRLAFLRRCTSPGRARTGNRTWRHSHMNPEHACKAPGAQRLRPHRPTACCIQKRRRSAATPKAGGATKSRPMPGPPCTTA